MVSVLLTPEQESRLREILFEAIRSQKDRIVWNGREYRVLVTLPQPPESCSDFSVFIGDDIIVVSPLLTFGEGPEAEHGEFGRAMKRLERATNEELLLLVQPTEGITFPSRIWGKGYPPVRVRWDIVPPITRSQDVRAAAFFHLLRRNKREVGPRADPYVHAVMARAPDVVFHLVRAVPEQMLVCVDGRPETGEQTAIPLLLPYGHLSFLEQMGISIMVGGKKIHSITQTAQNIWKIIVQSPFCDTAELLLAGGRIEGKEQKEDELMEVGDRALHQLRDVQSRYSRSLIGNTAPPSEKEIEGAVRDGLYFLLSARTSAPSKQILPPQIISSFAPPHRCRQLTQLMAELFSPAGRASSKRFFANRGIILPPEQMGQRTTISDAIKMVQSGGIDIDSLLERVYRGLVGKVVWVLDVSSSMQHTYELTMRLVRDLQGWAKRNSNRSKKGANLQEWTIVALSTELYVFTPTQDVGFFTGGTTPLYPALKYAKSLRPKIMIVYTDWEANENRATVHTWNDETKKWDKGQTVAARTPPPLPWAENVLTFDERLGTCPFAGQEGIVSVRIIGQARDGYWQFLSTVAQFAQSLLLAECDVDITREGGILTLTIREKER